MFPGRIWVALGSGELMNEHVTGDKWPEKSHRNQRLLESFQIMKALLRGETISHDGLIKVDRAKLWTKPPAMPLLVGAAITAQTAEWMGSWADGLVTIGQDYDVLEKIIDAFRRGGKSKPIFLQEQIAYAPTYEDAMAQAHDQWRFSVFKSNILADTGMPEDIDEISKYVRAEDVKTSVRVSADLQEHREWLQRNVDLGFDRIYLHNVCRKNQDFIAKFREFVFPTLKGASL
jgi:G6PDH family F420-dependent oxidoreductase